jgi:hypothetical protein
LGDVVIDGAIFQWILKEGHDDISTVGRKMQQYVERIRDEVYHTQEEHPVQQRVAECMPSKCTHCENLIQFKRLGLN